MSGTGARGEDSSDDLDLELYVEGIMKEMPVSHNKLKDIRNATENDAELQELQHCVKQGWPETLKETPAPVQSYWISRDEINENNGIMFKGEKIIIPKFMHQEMLRKIHTGQMGIQNSKESGQDVVCLPGYQQRNREILSNDVQHVKTIKTFLKRNHYFPTPFQVVHGK